MLWSYTVKYLYKYIYKGHNKVTICIAQNNETKVVDEIKHFQDAKWVSPQKAYITIIYRKLGNPPPQQTISHLWEKLESTKCHTLQSYIENSAHRVFYYMFQEQRSTSLPI